MDKNWNILLWIPVSYRYPSGFLFPVSFLIRAKNAECNNDCKYNHQLLSPVFSLKNPDMRTSTNHIPKAAFQENTRSNAQAISQIIPAEIKKLNPRYKASTNKITRNAINAPFENIKAKRPCVKPLRLWNYLSTLNSDRISLSRSPFAFLRSMASHSWLESPRRRRQ